MPFDWYMRKWVVLNITFELLQPAPIPVYEDFSSHCEKLIENTARLAAVDKRFTLWADSVGVEVGTVKTEVEKQSLIAENDAIVAFLYLLNRGQVEHIFKTFRRGWDYSSRVEQVLAFYDQLPNVKS
jgi:hypothetical protein